MGRPRILADSEVFSSLLRIIATDGEKAVAFSAVARATGLSGASLVQRYGALPAMVEAALTWAWDELDAMALTAEAEIVAQDKGPQALLKLLSERCGALPLAAILAASLRHARLRARASDWRQRVEAILAVRMQDRERAALVFALWQGQILWEGTGPRAFRMKDALRRLT